MEGTYNAIQGMVGGNPDSNTGLSPVQWGSLETTWTGKLRDQRSSCNEKKKRRVKGSLRKKRRRGSFVRGRGIPITTTKRWKQKITKIREATTIRTGVRSRQGIQYKVEESFDSKSLGERVVSSDVAAVMRSRNIEFVCKRLKPNTRLYAFFDNIDMNAFIVPKLIEIEMVSGTFSIGETVRVETELTLLTRVLDSDLHNKTISMVHIILHHRLTKTIHTMLPLVFLHLILQLQVY